MSLATRRNSGLNVVWNGSLLEVRVTTLNKVLKKGKERCMYKNIFHASCTDLTSFRSDGLLCHLPGPSSKFMPARHAQGVINT